MSSANRTVTVMTDLTWTAPFRTPPLFLVTAVLTRAPRHKLQSTFVDLPPNSRLGLYIYIYIYAHYSLVTVRYPSVFHVYKRPKPNYNSESKLSHWKYFSIDDIFFIDGHMKVM